MKEQDKKVVEAQSSDKLCCAQNQIRSIDSCSHSLFKPTDSLAKTTAKAQPMNPRTGAHDAQATDTFPGS